MVAIASGIVMLGALMVAKNMKNDPGPEPPSSGQTGELPLNTLNDSDPPPMPPSDPGSTTGGTVVMPPQDPPMDFDVPKDPDKPVEVANEPPRMLTVWVTETDGKAYSQPGFNMPQVRDLKQWEELLIVETSKENWDRVQDLQGNQFWVQKKIVTTIRPQNLNQPSVAEKKVMDFYTQVAHGEHSDAYVHLSPEWKRELSFDRFVKGYSHVDSLRSEIVNVLELGRDRFQVDVSMEAVEQGNPIFYLGIYTVERVDDRWYLTSGSLNRQADGI